jgi:hypothetical protein
MEDQFSLFLQARTWDQVNFIKYAKFTTVWPMARYLRNPLPEKPAGFTGHPTGWTGKVKRFLKNRLVVRRSKNAKLFWSILQGVKRGADRVSEDFVQGAMEKHRATLTKEPVNNVSESGFVDYYERVAEGFKPARPDTYEASTSASFTSKRSTGGARSEIRSYYARRGEYDSHGRSYFNIDHSTGEEVIAMLEVRPGQVKVIRGVPCPSLEQIVRDAIHEPKDVMVHAVLEPLKVRLITKGNSLRYWVSKFFQKNLWSHLFEKKQFSPIGKVLSQTDLIDLVEREHSLGLDLPKWVSGDYSGATDGLNLNHTKAAFEAFTRRCLFDYDPELVEVLKSVLYEQGLHYPGYTKLQPAAQCNGQLMGSTLSFPILCAVNLVTYWKSLEQYIGREVDLDDLPVLVNGDDILFRADDELYELWQRNTRTVGFELSLGKNYIHDRYLTINSQLYDHRGGTHFEKIEFFNVGLLTGQAKVTGRMGARTAPLWDLHEEAVSGAIDQVRAHKRFMHYHRESIASMSNKGEFNLFIPRELGGLGFYKPVDHPNRTTAFQRRIAAVLHQIFVEDCESRCSRLTSTSKPGAHSLFDGRAKKVVPKVGPLEEFVSYHDKRLWYEPPLCSEWPTDYELTWKSVKSQRDVITAARKLSRADERHDIRSYPYTIGVVDSQYAAH